jgi:ABC-2 type transport system ATP-binding protein
MIDAEHLTKFYGGRAAVRDVSFHVEQGEIVGLLGPNGAGKTTTMRMLTGYLPMSSGKAVVAGYDVSAKPMQVRKRLGYLPETVPLYTDMPVASYLLFIAKIRGVPPKARKRRVEEVMAMCRVTEVANRVIGKLSRGYRQRVGLAQAIIHNPDVIILDEPTVGLDPRQIIETRNVIRELAGSHSMILSTHILPEVSTLCDRVIIINRGRVLIDDKLSNLERQETDNSRLRLLVRGPQTEVIAALQALPHVLKVEPVETAEQANNSEASTATENLVVSTVPGLTHFSLESEEGSDLRELVAQTIIRQEWGLLELKNNAPTLEDIFVKLISSDVVEDDDVELATPLVEYDDRANQAVGRRRAFSGDELDELDELVVDEAEGEEQAKEESASIEAKTSKPAPQFLSEEE